MTQDQGKPSLTTPPAPAPLPAEPTNSPAYKVMLPEFEGPLDLLLHLCQTHELDILNISVSFIAQKYIEYLELMEDMAVEVAADYLVMAAHLAYLKSRELVPSPEPMESSEDGEETLDPREELIRRLLEYQKYKNAAETLGGRPIEGRNVFVRGAVLEADGEAGLAEHSVWKLIEHWASTLKKAKPEYTHDVVMDRMSISDRINQIVDLLEAGKGMVRFEDLLGQDLAPAELRHKVVVSLLAVLELARLRVVRILQQEATGTFFLAQVDGAALDDARKLTPTSAKESESSSESSSEATQEAQPESAQPETPPQAPSVSTASEAEATDAEYDAEAENETLVIDADADPESEAAVAEAEAAMAIADAAMAGRETTPEGGPASETEEEVSGSASGVGSEAGVIAGEATEPVVEDAAPIPSEAVEPGVVAIEDVEPVVEDAVEVSSDDVAGTSESEIVEDSVGASEELAEAPTSDSGDSAEPVELPPHDVSSESSPASAATGEEATDGQTQEEQTTTEE